MTSSSMDIALLKIEKEISAQITSLRWASEEKYGKNMEKLRDLTDIRHSLVLQNKMMKETNND